MNHIIACLWHLLGSESGASVTWIDAHDLADETLAYIYSSSLHWAITQITPASTNINPVNVYERSYTILVDVSGLVIFSTFISSITARMTQYRSLREDRARQQSALHRYFGENKVSLVVAKRVMDVVYDQKLLSLRRVREKDLEVLTELPEALRADLAFEVFSPYLVPHPFYGRLCSFDSGAIIRYLCRRGITGMFLYVSEELFQEDKLAAGMYIIQAGVVSYLRRGSAAGASKNDYLAEAALWVPQWLHRGRVVAEVFCEILGLSALEFEKALQKPGRANDFIRAYASFFIQGSEVSDTAVDSFLLWSDLWCGRERLNGMTFRACETVGLRSGSMASFSRGASCNLSD